MFLANDVQQVKLARVERFGKLLVRRALRDSQELSRILDMRNEKGSAATDIAELGWVVRVRMGRGRET